MCVLNLDIYNLFNRYIELCPHGITTGSKFLYRSESVCDPVDLKLSKQFVSPVNVLDTPCTAAANLILRDKKQLKPGFQTDEGVLKSPCMDNSRMRYLFQALSYIPT